MKGEAKGKYQKPEGRIIDVVIRLGGYVLKSRSLIFLAVLCTILSNIFALLGPYLSGEAINAIKPYNVDFDSVFFYCALMAVFYIASSLLSYFLARVMLKISREVSINLRKDAFNRLTELPVGYFDTNKTGDILSRFSYDIDVVGTSISNDLLQICNSVITVVGSLVMMLYLSPPLVSVFLVTVPVSLLVTRFMVNRVRPLFKERSAKLGELNGISEELITGQKTIRAYHQQQTMLSRFDKKNDEAMQAYFNADYHAGSVGPAVSGINNLSLTLISVAGALMYLFGRLSLGDVSSFILYSRRFSAPINEIANILSDLQSACAAAERVFRLIDQPPEPLDVEGASSLNVDVGSVDISGVSFGYLPEKKIIHNLNLDVKGGNLIAIVGPTGAGKTTIINLLMRFYDLNDGSISVDNKNISQITRKSLRLSYAMVLQDSWLFGGTVHENIAYGKPQATREEVIAVAKAAKIHSTIMSFPDGYDTQLREDGLNISQGQKQLITIARAMLLDAKILILDEATSNVDTQTELQIQSAMRKLMLDKTCFVIAHRLSTIKNADTILVMSHGNVVEQGSHEQLLKQDGLYSNLYNAQFL